ncbi:hypothetical protein PVIIG_06070, partial [Plasmodium vivax India VII]
YAYVKKFPDFLKTISAKDEVNDGNNKTQCDKYKRTNSDKLDDTDNSFAKTCAKIAQHQKDIIGDVETNKPSLCKYINYWFYNKINSTTKTTYYSLLNKFFTEIDDLKFCTNYHYKNINTDSYTELTKLYDLYDNFNKFKDESLKAKPSKCDDVKQCIEIYEEYAPKCREDYNNELCINLINFKYEYDKHRSNAISCQSSMTYLEPIKSDLASIVLLPFVSMTLVSFIFIFLHKVCNNTILNIF